MSVRKDGEGKDVETAWKEYATRERKRNRVNTPDLFLARVARRGCLQFHSFLCDVSFHCGICVVVTALGESEWCGGLELSHISSNRHNKIE
ncbi:hypothetical protein X798_01264 [Onchocerca flexuosa]|uniref:Uncharacterized protein n=1 Tax=Onchocerca flexuosa TaxID=387005 RepID=A0A238C3D2_9BILA|nr:hypothetical protein X798_01264 [Onchocerca flexuosa]